MSEILHEDDDKPFKIVKTNEREVEVQKPNKFSSFGTHAVKEKRHDLEIHHPETGEPIFTMTPKTYGKGYKLGWHPYMKDQYPDLERSHEFGNRHHTSGHFQKDHMEVGSKDSAQWAAKHLYTAAARNGFKDTLETRLVPKVGQDMDSGNIEHENHYFDRETGERIGAQGKEGPFKYSGAYAEKHGIDKGIMGQLSGTGYQKALAIHSQKGKQYNAIGQVSHGSDKTSGPKVHVYKAGNGVSDEQMSSAHEDQVRKEHGRSGYNLEVTRHSPTIFTAQTGHEQGYGRQHITSLAHQGTLTVHSHDPSYPNAFSHKF